MPKTSTMTISEQENTPVSSSNPSTTSTFQNPSSVNKVYLKRSKPNSGDDLFEHAHRLANGVNQYFSFGDSRVFGDQLIPNIKQNVKTSSSQRSSFPPFRIKFTGSNNHLSELSIIKNINKFCKTTITYGRFTMFSDNKVFLVYANSGEQFDYLMNRTVWPASICEREFEIDFPTKVPTSYSIVVLGVPPQWDLNNFEQDVKSQYPSIIKSERIFVRGGVPISKILKDKRLLIEGEYTAFKVQPYIPPVKVLRCFNCHAYNDHTAANYPEKDNPTCFKCGQHHPFDPNCTKKICCANCQQEHMAGNPTCPVKIEARKVQRDKATALIMKKPLPGKRAPPPPTSAWLNINNPTAADSHSTKPSTSSSSSNSHYNSSNNQLHIHAFDLSSIMSKLDLLMNKIDYIATEQSNTNKNIVSIENNSMLQNSIFNKLCPFVSALCELVQNKNTQQTKGKLAALHRNFTDEIHRMKPNQMEVEYEGDTPHLESNESDCQ